MTIWICILVVAVVIAAIYLQGSKKKDGLEENKPDKYYDEVTKDLNREDSVLYQYILAILPDVLKDPELNKIGAYDLFVLHVLIDVSNAVDEECQSEKGGVEWLKSNVASKINRNNLSDTISDILSNEEIQQIISKSFIDRFHEGVLQAQISEEQAIKLNKEYDAAPGVDEELHPRIPQPGEDSDEEITERSIEELSSMGTVEAADE